MAAEDREVAALKRLGLTEYEARVYLALVKMGPTKASEISFFGRVPRTKTYGAIKELERKGLLRTVSRKPESYMASSPNSSLIPLVQKLGNEVKESEEVVSALALTFEASKYIRRDTVYEAGDFIVLKDRKRIYGKVSEILNEANKTITIICTSNGLIRVYKTLSDALEKARTRGTSVRLATSINQVNLSVAKELNEVIEIRHLVTAPQTQFISVDSKQMIFLQNVPDDLETERETDSALLTGNRLLMEFHSVIFNRLWEGLPTLDEFVRATG